jgi:hypothetical protein
MLEVQVCLLVLHLPQLAWFPLALNPCIQVYPLVFTYLVLPQIVHCTLYVKGKFTVASK